MATPAWKNLKGMRRVQAEFKHLSADIQAKKFDFIQQLSFAGDSLLTWQLKLHNFDDDLPGGRQLNQDLRRLAATYGQDHILMQIEFPQDYPHQPFFVRLVSPRCVMYTGHVTAGGSICLEALTLSGTPGSWQPDFSVESLLNVILINMIDCPVTVVQTATGPGGRSGPLRIDFSSGNPTRGYSTAEARAAFNRTLENHRRMGWGSTAAPNAAAGGGGGAAAAATAAAGAAAGGSSAYAQRLQRRQQQQAQQALQQQQQALLQQQQQAQQQQQQQQLLGLAASVGGPPRVQLQLEYPGNWDYSQPIQRDTFRLVELPLPGQQQQQQQQQQQPAAPSDPLEAAAAAAQVDEADVQLLMGQGLTRDDAQAALLLAAADSTPGHSSSPVEGRLEDALLRAATCMDVGGCAKLWRDQHAPPPAVVDLRDEAADAAQQEQQERARQLWRDQHAPPPAAVDLRDDSVGAAANAAQREQQERERQAAAAARLLAEEVEQVLAHLDATGGTVVNRSKVLRIERVQNAKLWRRYCLKREELVDARGEAGVNERLLFHGTSPATVDLIAQNGFDFRLSQVAAYGNGLYFADHSATAWGYCQKQDAANLSAAARGIVGGHASTSWAPPLPPAAAAGFAGGFGGVMAAWMGYWDKWHAEAS
ncbi:hypothetical protein OEZ85_003974 [Tetradesmus obliquus]|uniref:Poly [ADP-ribose] polymerase n=1 Tax=Tetradesmus obliquus TaxID=3088 RepID=A0ABY8UFB8_TETOB|nr:hypothetical protein OEZ85_003974 [Tetradesmus obliquus]